MGLFSSSKKDQIVAIFDIGSGSVGGAIAHIPNDSNGIPTIIKATRVDIPPRALLGIDLFIADTQKALSAVAETLSYSSVGALDEIICVLASPWYVSETRMIKMERPRSFIFTDRIANELLQKEASRLADVYQKKYTTLESRPEMIEHHIMGVSLNGYPVSDPIGKRTKSIEMNMIVSLSPKLYLDTMRQTIAQTFHNTPLRFSSFVVASYIAVRDKYVSPDSYILLDISGEITDMALVSKGILKASLSFPFGRNTLFKSICTAYEISMRDAKELFGLWSTHTLEAGRKEKAAQLFTSIESSWGKLFKESLTGLPQTVSVPNTVFLTADSDIQEWFSGVIENGHSVESVNGGQKCTVVTLEGPAFLSMCNFKEGFCDPFLMIEAIAVMRKKR